MTKNEKDPSARFLFIFGNVCIIGNQLWAAANNHFHNWAAKNTRAKDCPIFALSGLNTSAVNSGPFFSPWCRSVLNSEPKGKRNHKKHMFETAWNIIWILLSPKPFPKSRLLRSWPIFSLTFQKHCSNISTQLHAVIGQVYRGRNASRGFAGFPSYLAAWVRHYKSIPGKIVWKHLIVFPSLSLFPVALVRKRNYSIFTGLEGRCWTLWGERRSWSPGFIKLHRAQQCT